MSTPDKTSVKPVEQLESGFPDAPLAPNRAGALTGLFVAGFVTFMNLYGIQPLLPYFRHLFGASELMVSLTVSASLLAVAVAAPVVGVAADSVGRKRVIVIAVVFQAIAMLFSGSAANLGQLIAWRFIEGLFVPGTVAAVMAYISEESPVNSVGYTMTIYISGTVGGGFAGRLISGLLTAHWGWRPCFVVLGVITLAGALATQWILPPEKNFVRGKRASLSLRPLFAHLKNPQLLATYAVGFNILFSLVATFTYVNFYLAQKPFFLGPAALGQIFAVYLAGAVLTSLAGRYMDRIGYRLSVLIAILTGAGGIALTLVRNLPAIIVGLGFVATSVFISQASASSNVGKVAKGARSSAAGLYVAIYYYGGFAGSIVPGFFWAKAGWSACVAVVLCAQALVALVAYRLWKD